MTRRDAAVFGGALVAGILLAGLAVTGGNSGRAFPTIMIGTEEDALSILHEGVNWGYQCVAFRNTREECHARVDKAMKH